MVERLLYTEDVGGSSPSTPTTIPFDAKRLFCGRAPAFDYARVWQIDAMDEIEKLGSQIEAALKSAVPAELVALVTTTSHGARLQALFLEASAHLLATHRDVLNRPSSQAARERRTRAKALVDLVRARRSAIGARRPSVKKALALLDRKVPQNVVIMRKAA